MSVINSDSMRAGASGVSAAGYVIENSCRFNPGDSAFMSRTPSGSGTGGGKVQTISVWLKRCNFGVTHRFLSGTATKETTIQFNDTNTLHAHTTSGADLDSRSVYRDPSAWYHVVVAYDTDNGTAGDRVRSYVNGVELTSYGTETTPSSGFVTGLFVTTTMYIGKLGWGSNYWDGYMAEFIGIDGQQLTPSSFGEFDSKGNWVPIDPTELTFGTHGFWLDFAVAPGTGNGAGTDVSGEGNHFTDSGLAANDQVNDSPTDDADNDVGNYATYSPIDGHSGTTLSDGNLTATFGTDGTTWLTQQVSEGKWFWMVQSSVVANNHMGPTNADFNKGTWGGGGGRGSDTTDGWAANWSATTTLAARTNNAFFSTATIATVDHATDWIVHAIDVDALKWWCGFYDDSAGTVEWLDGANTLRTSDEPGLGTNQTASISGSLPFSLGGYIGAGLIRLDCGQLGGQGIPIPDGFKYLNTANLPAPTITDPSKYFQVDTFTGTGSELQRPLSDTSGAIMTPDLVWIKDRDTSVEHVLTDSVRGATKEWNSDSSNAETTVAQGLKSFDTGSTGGFTLGTDGNYNTSSSLNVAWCWVEGATPGMDIVSYTGDGTSSRNISHSVGAVPEFMIVKNLIASGTYDVGAVYHASATSPEHYGFELATVSTGYNDAGIWSDTNPTSSVFTVGGNDQVNGSGNACIAYLWAGVEGYSKCQ